MATVNLNPNGTVTASWEISAGDTAHDALRTSGSGTYIRSPDQNKYVIVTLDDYSSGGTITSIRYCVSGFMFNARGGDTDIQVILENSSGGALFTETETLNFNSYVAEDHYGTARTTSDGSSAWTDGDLDGLRLNINTSPEDPPGPSYANVVKAWVEVTYTTDPVMAKVNGVADGSISKIDGVTNANMAKINGVTDTD